MVCTHWPVQFVPTDMYSLYPLTCTVCTHWPLHSLYPLTCTVSLTKRPVSPPHFLYSMLGHSDKTADQYLEQEQRTENNNWEHEQQRTKVGNRNCKILWTQELRTTVRNRNGKQGWEWEQELITTVGNRNSREQSLRTGTWIKNRKLGNVQCCYWELL